VIDIIVHTVMATFRYSGKGKALLYIPEISSSHLEKSKNKLILGQSSTHLFMKASCAGYVSRQQKEL